MNALTATTLALGLVVGSACAAPVEKTIEIVGPPIKLRYGEVHNAWQPPIDFPDEVKQKFANKTMPIVDWTVDIVYKNGSQVPLYDTYNHHYILSAGTRPAMQRFHDMMQDAPYGLRAPNGTVGWVKGAVPPTQQDDGVETPNNRKLLMTPAIHHQLLEQASREAGQAPHVAQIGSASGAEERHTSHRLPQGYAYMIDSPEALTPLFHFINTKDPSRAAINSAGDVPVSKLLQCPCVNQFLNATDGTVDGWEPYPPFGTCSPDFFAEGNPSCDITTYQGGWRCCEDGKFLIELDDVDVDDLPYDEVHGKFIFTYLDDDAHELGLKQLQFITQDASGYLDVTKGNIEYDVPACDLRNTRPEDCIYESSTVNFISGEIDADDDSLMSIPYTVSLLPLAVVLASDLALLLAGGTPSRRRH